MSLRLFEEVASCLQFENTPHICTEACNATRKTISPRGFKLERISRRLYETLSLRPFYRSYACVFDIDDPTRLVNFYHFFQSFGPSGLSNKRSRFIKK